MILQNLFTKIAKTPARAAATLPGFVIYSKLDSITVISVQYPLMRSQLVKERLLEGPINGLVSNAAHGWWKERTSLLVVSSTYCPDLLSYTNGHLRIPPHATY